MTTWKRSVGWTWILAASTGLGKAVGFTVGGPHGPRLIVSHHSRARLRSDHRQLWFRLFNSQTGYARKHLQCTPHPTLTFMNTHTTLHPSYMTTREYNEILFLYAIWVSCQSTGQLVVVGKSVTMKSVVFCLIVSIHVMLAELNVLEL